LSPAILLGTLKNLSFRLIINWPVIPDKRLILDRHLSKAEAYRELSKPIRYGFVPQQGGASVSDSDGVYPFTRGVTGPRVIKFADIRDTGVWHSFMRGITLVTLCSPSARKEKLPIRR
jgi:hypothetical protein